MVTEEQQAAAMVAERMGWRWMENKSGDYQFLEHPKKIDAILRHEGRFIEPTESQIEFWFTFSTSAVDVNIFSPTPEGAAARERVQEWLAQQEHTYQIDIYHTATEKFVIDVASANRDGTKAYGSYHTALAWGLVAAVEAVGKGE